MADRLGQTIRELSLTPAPPRAPWSIVSLRLELSRERNSARAWAGTLAEASRPDYAALFAQAALVAYARVAQPATTLSAPIITPSGRLPSEIDERACVIGRAAADLPGLDALHALTGLYPALLSDQRRAALGAFYTPPALDARLLDQAEDAGLDLMDARVLDPVAGGGIFLVHVATRMRERLRDSDPTFALARIAAGLHGFEVDPHAAGLAQNALELALADLTGAAGQVAPAMIQVCDTLEQPASPVFDLVVGNPPYGRVALTPDQRRRYARGLDGHANLYGVFTDIALRWTRAGGLIAYLTPTNFLAGQHFSALRNLLATEAPPVGIDFVHARAGVFDEGCRKPCLPSIARVRRLAAYGSTISSLPTKAMRR